MGQDQESKNMTYNLYYKKRNTRYYITHSELGTKDKKRAAIYSKEQAHKEQKKYKGCGTEISLVEATDFSIPPSYENFFQQLAQTLNKEWQSIYELTSIQFFARATQKQWDLALYRLGRKPDVQVENNDVFLFTKIRINDRGKSKIQSDSYQEAA